MDISAEDIAALDARHIWHPYAGPGEPTLVVDSAAGVHLTLADGTTLIDAMSSWWAAAHGHGHPRLKAAAAAQIERMSHIMFGGLTHEPAARLTRNLMELTRGDFEQVFYSDSGSVSVEVAIKMALQYARGLGHPERTKMLTWRSGYHGDTFAAMSVCDPEGGMHSMWTGTLARQVFAPAPPTRGASPAERATYLHELEACITEEVAALVIEPVVQGAGGMRFHDHELVRGARDICDRHGIVLVADEIATGFGRTGDLFATQAAGVVPDIMCVGKAMTGGFMTMAATLATAKVAEGMRPRALMHGPTFMANPLACAVSAAATELILEGHWREQVAGIEKQLQRGLTGLAEEPGVADVRVLGAIGVVEMEREVNMAAATAAAVEQGVWLRPFGRLIYIMPPFISTADEVTLMCRGVRAAVAGGRQ
ncbi:adenosylmethionine--8-amino-7-oxononanoate transaminase [Corynebacterium tuberculostearicum]|uniref:Adenosylmethionine-8-amino-7-oxononanoate aminotransferase n=1 Tax=Corynebacterium tuberculostearicum TaxID=38304 RepID=A0AAE4NKY5_9CORY|nr:MULTISPECIES: adenosylmethionine--8-amino-7-oxononanoate transaminase [Corynebacterium]MCT1428793.1 adenosylmethionine--8-amino-7-oxononanoate transaminase [Corynebacterium sp. p3-SID1241]MDV2418666.1 adenosylmethionine--8-amino-7-oxononanoate transaminase [Corynebacterium tuberculostearicum]